MTQVDLRRYDNAWYSPGRSVALRSLWMFFGLPLFRSTWFASSAARVALLRLFGAGIGKRVVIRQHVTVKYPWHLTVADDCWIGEQVWIDNLTAVRLASSVCISQGAYLCTGNHDWSDPAFGLKIAPISLEQGSWAGARCLLMPGTCLSEGAVASAGSVVSGRIPAFQVFAGNPAVFVKQRMVRSSAAVTPEWQEEIR
jgi:putative colanic acid biosynthesis acetyltransferase WcaF